MCFFLLLWYVNSNANKGSVAPGHQSKKRNISVLKNQLYQWVKDPDMALQSAPCLFWAPESCPPPSLVAHCANIAFMLANYLNGHLMFSIIHQSIHLLIHSHLWAVEMPPILSFHHGSSSNSVPSYQAQWNFKYRIPFLSYNIGITSDSWGGGGGGRGMTRVLHQISKIVSWLSRSCRGAPIPGRGPAGFWVW